MKTGEEEEKDAHILKFFNEGKKCYNKAIHTYNRATESKWCNEAIQNYKRVIELDPEYITVWFHMGLVYSKIPDYQKAIECYETATRLDPNDKFSWGYMGIAYDELKNYPKAIMCFEKAIEINPEDKMPWFYTGLVYNQLEKYSDAIQSYTKVTELDSNFDAAWYHMGLVREKLEDYDEAISCFEQAVKANPKNRKAGARLTELLAMISSDGLQEEVVQVKVKKSDINITRGSQILGGRYIFKVKVENRTQFNIIDITIQLISYPKDSLELVGTKYKEVGKISPGGFVSPSYEFKPTSDCIRGKIHASISYIDHLDKAHTETVPEHEIELVCGLLRPKDINVGEFVRIAQGVLDFERTGEDIKIPYTPKLIHEKLKVLLPDQNFNFVTRPEAKIVGTTFIGEFKGFAEGKYSKNQVGLQIIITGHVDQDYCTAKIEGFCQDPGMLAPLVNEWSGLVAGEIEAPNDCTVILELAKGKCWTNVEEVVQEKNWDLNRTQTALESLEKARIARRTESATEGVRWYFPGLKED